MITIGAVFLTPLSDRQSGCVVDLFDVGLKKLDGIEAKRAVVGQVHLVARVAGVEAVTDLGVLHVGEMFDAVEEQPADRN
ncbi:MAG TPA: hypothetical protein VI030_13440 [Propionibacteriaceae bacterium]